MVVVLPASTCAMTPMLRRLRRGVVFVVLVNLSRRVSRAAGCAVLSQPPPGDSPGRSAAVSSPVAGARAWVVHVPAVGTMLVWIPIGIYQIATGHVGAGLVEMIFSALFV